MNVNVRFLLRRRRCKRVESRGRSCEMFLFHHNCSGSVRCVQRLKTFFFFRVNEAFARVKRVKRDVRNVRLGKHWSSRVCRNETSRPGIVKCVVTLFYLFAYCDFQISTLKFFTLVLAKFL